MIWSTRLRVDAAIVASSFGRANITGASEYHTYYHMIKRLIYISLSLALLASGCSVGHNESASLKAQLQAQQNQLEQITTEQDDSTRCSEEAKRSGFDTGSVMFLSHYSQMLRRCFVLQVLQGPEGESISIIDVADGTLFVHCDRSWQPFGGACTEREDSSTSTEPSSVVWLTFPVNSLNASLNKYMAD
jgi:hypothetical protein